MLHFIWVSAICKDKMDLGLKDTIIFENYNQTTLDMYNGLSEVYYIKPEGQIY